MKFHIWCLDVVEVILELTGVKPDIARTTSCRNDVSNGSTAFAVLSAVWLVLPFRDSTEKNFIRFSEKKHIIVFYLRIFNTQMKFLVKAQPQVCFSNILKISQISVLVFVQNIF